ncbi:MAG TPA: hypothetical protein VJW77_00805 [Terriglobia bacterium]|nr:hypothetical protein [Terriglobia bacterium]
MNLVYAFVAGAILAGAASFLYHRTVVSALTNAVDAAHNTANNALDKVAGIVHRGA